MPSAQGPQRANWRRLPRTPADSPLFAGWGNYPHPKTEPRVLSGPAVLKPRQLVALLAAPDKRTRLGKRDAALLAVLACGGLRLGECVRLTLDCVELGQRVRITTRTSKSRKLRLRTITLPSFASRLFRDWLTVNKSRWWVFPGRHNECLTTRQAGRVVRSYLEKIGCGWAHPHTLRHSYATILIHQSHDIWLVQKELGHASVTTTNIYAHADPSDADSYSYRGGAEMTLMGQIHPDRADTTLTIASWRERLRLALTILRGKPVTFIFPSPIVNIFHEPKETNVTDSDAAADKLEEAMR